MAACPVSGLLRRRARPLERAWARVFREAGARVVENMFLRDTNLPDIAVTDGRRLEVVALGLSVEQGVPLGCDATLVSPLHADGSVWAGADEECGVALRRGEADKRATYPELVGSDRLRLMVLACEVGGRWSSTCVRLVRQLAGAKARSAPAPLRASAAQAWRARWWGLLSVAAQGAFAATLAEDAVLALEGMDGPPPVLADVLLDAGAPPPISRLPARG